MSAEWRIRLEAAKEAAQAEHDDIKSEAQVSLLDHLFEVSPAGSGVFKFVLQDAAYRIQLSNKGKRLPLAYCRIGSHWLTAVGVAQAVDQLALIVSTFGEIKGGVHVSRIDICVDFVTALDLGDMVKDHWVTRGRDIKQHWSGAICSGWSFAPSAVVSAALYDKTLELLRSHKDYLKPIWSAAGWKTDERVYRLEFRFEREALEQLGARDYPAVLDRLGALWRYGTDEWLRLAVPNPDDDTKSRWPTHPLWVDLAAVSWSGSGGAERIRAKRDSAPARERLYGALLSNLAGYMATTARTESEEALLALYDEARGYYDDRWQIAGEGFEAKVLARAARKAKEYNLPYPRSTERAAEKLNQLVAKAYRKATGG